MLSDIFSNHLLMNALLAWATRLLMELYVSLAGKQSSDR